MKDVILRRLGIIGNALTQLLASVLCINLNANESTSGTCYRRRHDNRYFKAGYKTINFFFRIIFRQENHCLQTAVNERKDSQELIDAYRNK